MLSRNLALPLICSFILLLSAVSSAMAQSAADTRQKKGYTLTFTSNDDAFDPALKQVLMTTFFNVYPKLAKAYNKAVRKDVAFVIDTAYKGVAATSNGRVVFSAAYMRAHPKDIDVVTHEVMHIVQDYGRSVGPGWLTEGIADYARYKFGVANAAAPWSLPDLKAGQSYTNSYRVTARFLVWAEKRYAKNLVKTLDSQLRAHTYTPSSWAAATGKSLDELWATYVTDPFI